ncbi:30S ribosomal protein S18 [Ignicoccus pacificus DSM 13166]|uniref:30S ribosomal protein S18 n=1 Tax=Ignicoccus pacificus DSM 13166 TaxID=940294 RepID=A0A977PJC6_9CREN|nr:30S ribosomal protein S18 [Ignicoccus pacificus DSM 13166]
MEENTFAHVTIRYATERDLPQVVLINRKELPENYPYSFFEYILFTNPKFFYVAEINGKIVGYLMAQKEGRGRILLNPIPEITKEEPTIHLLSIAVLKKYQGKGIGSQLVKKLIEEALKEGIRYIYLEVRVSNERAQKLYEKHGFKKVKRLAHYYMDGEDAYVMLIDLDELRGVSNKAL